MSDTEFVKAVYDLIAKTSIELGYSTDGKTMASLAKIFANDIQTDKMFKNMDFEDIQKSFSIGVRHSKEQQFLNISTFYRWVRDHKQRMNEAYYSVHTLNQDPKTIPHYKPKQKLLK
tara:strand:+ start:3045 stop:3395 length:351 start_codon:yes stop_codon:yes gene_type:complete